nr:MFS transporter [Parahaliea mediterranea]
MASFVGIGVGVSSLSYYAAGIFMTPMEQDFGWSRSSISAQSIFAVAILALLSPFIGGLIDRIGIKRVAFFSLAAYATGLLATSFIPNSILLFYAITLATTTFAAGSSPVTFTRAVTGWFDHRRGLALGIALMSTGIAGILAPMLLTEYVADHGWRAGYRMLALVVALGALIVIVFLKDDSSASVHRGQPDSGRVADEKLTTASGAVPAQSARTLYSDPVFKKLAVIFFLVSAAVSGLIVHFIPMLIDTGMAPASAGRLASLIGLSVIIGRIVAGIMIDRYFAPRVAALLFCFAAVGFTIFIAGGIGLAPLAAVAVGFAMGAEVDLIGYLVSRYFGLASYGVLYGTLYGIFLIGAGLAPFVTGMVYDLSGSYQPALIASACALFLAAAFCLSLKAFPGETA